MITILGRVRGIVRFPEHPDREGTWGLLGGEDAIAERDTFRSIGEAMTWCRKILDDELRPRHWEAAGELVEPYEPPVWNDAEVRVWRATGYGVDELAEFATGIDRTWVDERRSVVVRHD